MSAQHTAGPWSVVSDTDIIGTENDPANECVGEVDVAHVYLRTVPGRTEANARLIAAAPDLLEFAQEVRRSGDTRLASMAIAVISKAEGGAA